MAWFFKTAWRVLRWGWPVFLAFAAIALVGSWGILFAILGLAGYAVRRWRFSAMIDGTTPEQRMVRGQVQTVQVPFRIPVNRVGYWASTAAMAIGFGVPVVIALFSVNRIASGVQPRSPQTRTQQTAQVQTQAVQSATNVPVTPAPQPEAEMHVVREIKIPLQGESKPSEKLFDITADVPPGWHYRFIAGPPSAKVRFDDGSEFSISDNVGVRGGKAYFTGPVGKDVVIEIGPLK